MADIFDSIAVDEKPKDVFDEISLTPAKPKLDLYNAELKAGKPQSVLSKAWEAIRPTALIGPTTEQRLAEAVDIDERGQPIYKPAAGAIEREGFFPALADAGPKVPKLNVDSPAQKAVLSALLATELRRRPSEWEVQHAASAINAGLGFVDFAISPLGLMTGGVGKLGGMTRIPLGKITAGLYSADIARHVPEAARQAGEASVTGTPREQAEANIGLGTSVVLPGLLASHIASKEDVSKPLPPTAMEPLLRNTVLDIVDKVRRGELRSPLIDRAAVNIMAPGTMRPAEQPAFVPPTPEAPPMYQFPTAAREFHQGERPVFFTDQPLPQPVIVEPPLREPVSTGKLGWQRGALETASTVPERTRLALDTEKQIESDLANILTEAERIKEREGQLSDIAIRQLEVRIGEQVQKALQARKQFGGLYEVVEPEGFTPIDNLIARARFLGENAVQQVNIIKQLAFSKKPIGAETLGKVSFGAEAPTLATQPLPERTRLALEAERAADQALIGQPPPAESALIGRPIPVETEPPLPGSPAAIAAQEAKPVLPKPKVKEVIPVEKEVQRQEAVAPQPTAAGEVPAAEVDINKPRSKQINTASKEAVGLFAELSDLTVEFNARKTTKKRKTELISRGEELRRELSSLGYSNDQIYDVEMGLRGVPLIEKPSAAVKPPELMTPSEIDALQPPKTWEESKDPEWVKAWRGNNTLRHKSQIREASKENKPVSAAAIDTYGIKLPAGYVREGDRYVFKPEPKQPEPAPVKPQEVAEAPKGYGKEALSEALKVIPLRVNFIETRSNQGTFTRPDGRPAVMVSHYGDSRNMENVFKHAWTYFKNSEQFDPKSNEPKSWRNDIILDKAFSDWLGLNPNGKKTVLALKRKPKQEVSDADKIKATMEVAGGEPPRPAAQVAEGKPPDISKIAGEKETLEHASRVRASESGSLIDADGVEIKPGEQIKLNFAGGPADMPSPWTLVKAENYFSSVNGKLNPRIVVRAANGVERTFDRANEYSPRKPSPPQEAPVTKPRYIVRYRKSDNKMEIYDTYNEKVESTRTSRKTAEHDAAMIERYAASDPNYRPITAPWAMTLDQWKKWADPSVSTTPEFHKVIVESAHREGKPVPPEVLKEYGLEGKQPPAAEKVDVAKKIADKLEGMKFKEPGRSELQMNVLGIPAYVWNGAVNAAQAIIRGGGKLFQAVNAAIRYIRQSFKQQNRRVIDESRIRAVLEDSMKEFERDTPLPDFQEHSISKALFAEPFGMERLPVFGKVFSGRRRLGGDLNDAIVTYWNERQNGRSIASVLAQEYAWLNKAFKVDAEGNITNIKPFYKNASLKISDVFENLQRDFNSYELTPEQRRAYAAMRLLEEDFNRLERKYKIGGQDNEIMEFDEMGLDMVNTVREKTPYFTRIVTARPKGADEIVTTGNRVGSRAYFERKRVFDTEQQGWEKGYKYETDIAKRLATRAQWLYKRMADKRLMKDPSLASRSRKQVEAAVKASYADELAEGKMTEAQIEHISDTIVKRGTVNQPAFQGKVFDAETAKVLRQAFPEHYSGGLRIAADVNNALKALWLGMDLGVGFIQGQMLIAYRPKIWAKAQMNSMRALFSKSFFPEYVRRNLEPIREMAQLGSSVGRMEEMMAGMERGELIHRIPGVKQTLGKAIVPFARQFQTFLDTAKVEIWKGLREVTPKSEWAQTMQSIESILSSNIMERSALGQRRAIAERALLIAPSYYRGALNLMEGILRQGRTGKISRRAISSYLIGGAILYYAVGMGLGMTYDELTERMNPARGDFLLWKFRHGNRTTEFGFGGVYKSLLKMTGNAVRTTIENPGNWLALSSDKNPFVRWYRSHAGPVPALIWDQVSTENFMGKPVNMKDLTQIPFPMAARTALGFKTSAPFNPVETGATFFGLSSHEKPNQNISEANRIANNFLRTSDNPKYVRMYLARRDSKFPESPYKSLIEHLGRRDFPRATKEYERMVDSGIEKKDIMQYFDRYFGTVDEDNPYKKPTVKPFTGSAEAEIQFIKSLKGRKKAIVEMAIQERRDIAVAYYNMLRDMRQ